MAYLILAFLSITFAAKGQENLYDFEHSKKFGSYLLKSGQFNLAVQEFERLHFLQPNDTEVKFNILKSYRYLGQFEQGVNRASTLFPDPILMPAPAALEYTKLLMGTSDWAKTQDFLSRNTQLASTDKELLLTSQYIFKGDLPKAKKLLSTSTDSTTSLHKSYLDLLNQPSLQPKKSPFLAGTMSAIIPGSGRVYTKDWKDGLVAFLFTTGMAYQSYRGFAKNGVKSSRGWGYGAVGLGFYLGNIYGSVKSAKQYNQKKVIQIQHEASRLFSMYYAN